jgi:hypothetical protein
VAALALTAAGLLTLTPYAFGYRGRERAADIVTGAALAAVAVITLACWSLAWRRRLRADRVLAPPRSRTSKRSERRHARAERLVKSSKHRELAVAPDPAQVLTDLRELLIPLLTDQSLLTDRVVLREGSRAAPGTATLDPGHVADAESGRDAEPPADASHLVQAPGQLRGARSASFLTAPTADSAGRYADVRTMAADDLLRGAELLVVGSGEEESW